MSVIIPVKDRRESVRVAVASVTAQSSPVCEIIVVDDGSEEPPYIEDIVGDIPFRLLRLGRSSGPAAARQVGIDAARGELIAFLDSDDAWLPDKISAQLERVSSRPSTELWAVTCGWFYTDHRGRLDRSMLPREAAGAALFASGCWFNPGSTVMLPRRAFAQVGAFDPRLRRLEDYDWFLRFGLAGGQLLVSPTAGTVIYRRRRKDRALVRDAATQISLSFREALRPRELSRMEAWLCVERGIGALGDRYLTTALVELLKSYDWHPRLRLQLDRWWTHNQFHPDEQTREIASALARAAALDAGPPA